jgi:hypothetical protein
MEYRQGQLQVIQKAIKPLRDRLRYAMCSYPLCNNPGITSSVESSERDGNMDIRIKLLTLNCAYSWYERTTAVHKKLYGIIGEHLEVEIHPKIDWDEIEREDWGLTLWTFWIYVTFALHLAADPICLPNSSLAEWCNMTMK